MPQGLGCDSQQSQSLLLPIGVIHSLRRAARKENVAENLEDSFSSRSPCLIGQERNRP